MPSGVRNMIASVLCSMKARNRRSLCVDTSIDIPSPIQASAGRMLEFRLLGERGERTPTLPRLAGNRLIYEKWLAPQTRFWTIAYHICHPPNRGLFLAKNKHYKIQYQHEPINLGKQVPAGLEIHTGKNSTDGQCRPALHDNAVL